MGDSMAGVIGTGQQESPLVALHRRASVAAQCGIPSHALSGWLHLQAQHRKRLALGRAQRASTYRPHLRAAVTSQVVLAAAAHAASAAKSARVPLSDDPAPEPPVGSAVTSCSPSRPSDAAEVGRALASAASTGRGSGRASSAAAASSAPVAATAASTGAAVANLAGRLGSPSPSPGLGATDYAWMDLVTNHMRNYYAQLQRRQLRLGAAREGGRRDLTAESKGLMAARDAVVATLGTMSVGEVAQQLMDSAPAAASSASASASAGRVGGGGEGEGGGLWSIYTGVVDVYRSGLNTLPGRAAVMLGLHGVLAAEHALGSTALDSASTLNVDNFESKLEEWQRSGAERMAAATCLADAVLRNRGLAPLPYDELRLLVLVIAALQGYISFNMSGAAMGHWISATHLPLLAALARLLAVHPLIPRCETTTRALLAKLLVEMHCEVSELAWRAMAAHGGGDAAQKDARAYLKQYVAAAKTYADARSVEMEAWEADASADRIGAGHSGTGSRDDKEDGLLYVRVWAARRVPEVLAPYLATARAAASAGGSGGGSQLQPQQQLVLGGAARVDEARRRELLRALLAVGLDGAPRSLVAVGREGMSLLVAHTAVVGHLRSKTAEDVVDLMVQATDPRDDAPFPPSPLLPPLKGAAAIVPAAVRAAAAAAAAGGVDEGPIALRLMSSAALLRQYAGAAGGGGEGAAGGGGEGAVGAAAGAAQQQQEPLDPFFPHSGVPGVVFASLLPCPASFWSALSFARRVSERHVNCTAAGAGRTACLDRSDRERLYDAVFSSDIAQHGVARLVCLDNGAVEAALLVVARFHLEALRLGVDVLVVPELMSLGSSPVDMQLQEAYNEVCFATTKAAGQPRQTDAPLRRQGAGKGEGGGGSEGRRNGVVGNTWAGVGVRRDGADGGSKQQAVCGLESKAGPRQEAHCTSQEQVQGTQGEEVLRLPLRGDWRSRRRVALNRAACAMLDTRGVAISDEAGRREKADRRLSDGQVGPSSSEAVLGRRNREAVRLLCRHMLFLGEFPQVSLRVSLTVVVCKRGQGGAVGVPVYGRPGSG